MTFLFRVSPVWATSPKIEPLKQLE